MSGTISQHGSHYRYKTLGCRCALCVESHRRRTAENRAARLAAGTLTHGTRSAYDAGCRCEPCRQVRRDVRVRLNETERAARKRAAS